MPRDVPQKMALKNFFLRKLDMCFKNNYFFPIRFTSGGRVLLETACVRGCRGGDSDKNPFLDSPGQRKAGNVLEPEHWQKPWRFLFHPQTVFAFCEKWSTDMSQAKRLQCDILVCGAGPAGASAALAAASQGARVLVLEEREKEEASGKASGKTSDDAFALVPPYLLSKLPLEKTDDLVLRTTRHTSVYLDDRYEMSMSERMRVIRGDVLLQKLRETAEEHGTSLLWGHRLWRILDEHTAEVEGPDEKMLIIDAEVIIGAEGSYSPVGHCVREGRASRTLPVLRARIRIEKWHTDEVGLFFERQHPTGFGWVVPCGNFASIGVCGPCKEEDETPKRLKSLLLSLAAMGHLSGNIRCEPSMKMIPVYQQGRLVRDSLVLAGTAARHVHPISGEGMTYAIFGGEMAGRWAATAVGEGRMNALRNYEEEWEAGLGSVLRNALRLRRRWEAHKCILREVAESFRFRTHEAVAP